MYSVVCPKHTPNQHFASHTRSQPSSPFSLLPAPIPPPTLLSSMSAEANCQRLWDTFWQHFEHSLCRSLQAGFASVCLCMTGPSFAFFLLTFTAHTVRMCIRTCPLPVVFFFLIGDFSVCLYKGGGRCSVKVCRKYKQVFAGFTGTLNYGGRESSPHWDLRMHIQISSLRIKHEVSEFYRLQLNSVPLQIVGDCHQHIKSARHWMNANL